MTHPIDPADLTGADAIADTIPFTPAQPAPRHDGWTAERQRIFIQALAETGCVTEAATAANTRPHSAYRLRLRPDAADFNRAWGVALDIAAHRLTSLAFERAIHGTPKAIYHKGEKVGEEYVPSDRMLMFLLKHFDRRRYGNLSGFTPVNVPCPVQAARDALPDMLAPLRDSDEEIDAFFSVHYQPTTTADGRNHE
jgi:hypothetical protein